MDDTKGFNEYDWRDFDALDLHLRAIGSRAVKLHDLKAGDAAWDNLHATRKKVVAGARAAINHVKDGEDGDDLAKTNRSHDLLMAALDAIDGEMDRRKALGQTTPLTGDQLGRPNQSGEADASGASRAARTSGWVEYRNGEPRELRVLAPNQPITEQRAEGPGVGDIARAMIFGPKSDVERRALSEGTDSAGGYTVPTVLASEFIDKLRAKSVVFQAGAQTVPMTSDNLAIARITGDPTVAWTAENAEITASDPTFDAVTLAPKKLTALVKVSRELLEDSVNISAALEAAFTGAMSIEMDRALLFGTGPGDDEPLGLFGISGINSVSMGTNGAIPNSHDDLIDLLYEIKLDNGADPSAFIMHSRTWKTFAKMKDGNGNPIVEPKATADVRKLVTNSVPVNQTQGSSSVASTVLTGDFSKMLVGVRTSMDLRLLNERYAEFDQVGFLARLRVDVAVENPVHFAKLIGVLA